MGSWHYCSWVNNGQEEIIIIIIIIISGKSFQEILSKHLAEQPTSPIGFYQNGAIHNFCVISLPLSLDFFNKCL